MNDKLMRGQDIDMIIGGCDAYLNGHGECDIDLVIPAFRNMAVQLKAAIVENERLRRMVEWSELTPGMRLADMLTRLWRKLHG